MTPSFWDVHLGHILLLTAWVLVVAGVQLRTTLRAWNARAGRTDGRRRPPLPRSAWLAGAAGAAVLSAAVHLSVTGEHFGESALYGGFFLVLAAAQLAWGVRLLLRPSRAWLSAGAAASVLVALLWLATRTIGMPVGPAAGEIEDVGVLDVVASVAEVAVAACALAAFRVADGWKRASVGAAPQPLLRLAEPGVG
jgi:hypothetical protein